MKYYQEEYDLYIEIKASVFAKIQMQANGEYPNENGGMLAGHYSSDKHTVYVEEVVVPTEKKTGRTSFVRSTTGLESVWKKLGEKGLRYIGEWHSHPNGTTQYSATDMSAMRDIEKEVSIENPILLIVSVKNEGIVAQTFYCYKNNKLLEYRKMIDLRELYGGLQKQMETSLNVNREFISHAGSKGDATEQHWIDFLRTYLPDRYKVDKAIIIDSTGNVSWQMDIVIYDGLYTPFIFNQDGFKYVPAESVYAVFEVKQDVKGNLEYAAQHVESVRKLQRTSIDMVNSGKRTDAVLLTKIIGGILTTTNSYKDSHTIENQLKKLKGYQTLDMGCFCNSGSFYVDYEEKVPPNINNKNGIEEKREYIKQLYESRTVNDVIFSDKEVSLFTFFLQLVSYLKSIGTVPAIDINEYLKPIGAKIDEII
ncbi:MAG: Mov34/MPN/PAD-1 family protein [Bacteroidales bacterium]|nr:Mov34/MPN/PAD-1 family protein [Bacteroidales bacterium]